MKFKGVKLENSGSIKTKRKFYRQTRVNCKQPLAIGIKNFFPKVQDEQLVFPNIISTLSNTISSMALTSLNATFKKSVNVSFISPSYFEGLSFTENIEPIPSSVMKKNIDFSFA